MPYKEDPRTGSRHNREHHAEYLRRWRANKKESNGVRATQKPFKGVDGEGGGEKGTTHPGYHAYFLLSAGKTKILPKPGNIRITTGQALEYLSSLSSDFCYVGYFFDYDVTKILEDLPFHKLERLMKRDLRRRRDGRGLFPVDYGPYEIDYLPRKEFKVRKTGQTKWVVINDVGPFFQCRFLEAIQKWDVGTPEEWEIIARGKDMRGNFQVSDIEDIAVYNALEIKLLEQLMEKFRTACANVNLEPQKWQGPGQLAKALMARERVPLSKNVPLLNDPDFRELMDYARSAYYGGRPELAAIGPVNRPVWQWDINSAYPAAMLHVPCLIHDGWEKEEYVGGMAATKIDADSAIVYGTFSPKRLRQGDQSPLWNGLPFRKADGTICYPGTGSGWYWDFEIAASIHQDFLAREAWVYRRQCDCKPLGFIEEVYKQRLALGKDGPGIVLKLTVNSVYGVCVQSIGSPPYANAIWGSFITAWCRTQIQHFIHSSPSCSMEGTCGKDILMVATDSVATWRDRQDMEESRELGAWSCELHSQGMFLIQPGLYFGSSGKHAKTRGIPLSAVEGKEAEFRAAFQRMVKSKRLEDGDVSVPATMFVGIRAALHRRNMSLLGQWIEYAEKDDGTVGKTVRFDWTTKRMPYPVFEPNASHSYLETLPILGAADDISVPYSKDIGGILQREVERAIFEAMPDWQVAFTPGEMDG